MARRPSDANLGFNPLEDSQFADTIQDFISIYTTKELEQRPFLQAYVVELLARWGRWHQRGRAPALCFEAACVGGLSYLNRSGRDADEYTARADGALARLLAGLVIDEVEPTARKQGGNAIREKAIGIVADEFLARTVSPLVANSAKKRMKKRKTVFKVGGDPVNFQQGETPRRRSDKSINPSGIVARNESIGADIGRLASRRPSIENSRLNQQRQEYYNSNYTSQVPLNMEPIPGPNSYYADTAYGRRRKGSQDSLGNSDASTGSSSFLPRNRQDLGPPTSRSRQGSIPLDDRYAEVNLRARQGSADERERSDSRYPPDTRQQPRSRKGSAEPAGPFGEPSLQQNRGRKVSASDSNSSMNQSVDYGGGQQLGSATKDQNYYNSSNYNYPEMVPNYALYPDDQRIAMRSRKDPMLEISEGGVPSERSRSRAGSIDRGFASSYHSSDSRVPPRQQNTSNLNSPRRPSQKGPLYQPSQPNGQRQRYPTSEEVYRPDDRSTRPGNLPTTPNRSQNYITSRQDSSDPLQGRMESRRPSQEKTTSGRRPSEESVLGRSTDMFREPSRSKTPTIVSEYSYPQARGKPTEIPVRTKTPQLAHQDESKKIDDLGTSLQNSFYLAMKRRFKGKNSSNQDLQSDPKRG